MLKLFYLKNCPFCKRALGYIEQLKEQYPEFRSIDIELIEESENPELADSFDYYYVPTFYFEDKKLHEGGIFVEEMENLLRSVLNQKA